MKKVKKLFLPNYVLFLTYRFANCTIILGLKEYKIWRHGPPFQEIVLGDNGAIVLTSSCEKGSRVSLSVTVWFKLFILFSLMILIYSKLSL